MTEKEKELLKTIREHTDPRKALETAIKIIVEIISPKKPLYVTVVV